MPQVFYGIAVWGFLPVDPVFLKKGDFMVNKLAVGCASIFPAQVFPAPLGSCCRELNLYLVISVMVMMVLGYCRAYNILDSCHALFGPTTATSSPQPHLLNLQTKCPHALAARDHAFFLEQCRYGGWVVSMTSEEENSCFGILRINHTLSLACSHK